MLVVMLDRLGCCCLRFSVWLSKCGCLKVSGFGLSWSVCFFYAKVGLVELGVGSNFESHRVYSEIICGFNFQ